jgi:hypothetical protein
MGPDEPDIHKPDGELDDDDQPIPIPFDVEYKVLVSYGIHGAECLPDIGETSPFTPFHDTDQFLQGHPRIGMVPDVFLQGLFCKDPHVLRHKDKRVVLIFKIIF